MKTIVLISLLTLALSGCAAKKTETARSVPARDFGTIEMRYFAIGDGVTDDTAAVQAVFNRVCPGDTILVDKVYLMRGTLKVPDVDLVIQRSAPESCLLWRSFAGPMFLLGDL